MIEFSDNPDLSVCPGCLGIIYGLEGDGEDGNILNGGLTYVISKDDKREDMFVCYYKGFMLLLSKDNLMIYAEDDLEVIDLYSK